MRSVMLRSVLAVVAILLPSVKSVVAQDKQTVAHPIIPGKTVELQISAGEIHNYVIALRRAEFLRVVVDQRALDVSVILFAPSGEKLTEINLWGSFGPEPVSWEAGQDGIYRLQVQAVASGPATSKYILTGIVRANATPQDRWRLEAEHLLVEVNDLRRAGGAEALRRGIEKTEQAQALWERLGDKNWIGYTLNKSGTLYNDLGERQKALDFYNRALQLRRASGDRVGEGNTLYNIGLVYAALDEAQKALEFYQRALPLRRATGDMVGEAATLHSIANVYNEADKNEETLMFFKRALVLERAMADRKGEGGTLDRIGLVYEAMKEYEKAKGFYQQALAARRESKDRAGEADTLSNLGDVFHQLDQYDKAREHYESALSIFRDLKDGGNEALTLNDLGDVHYNLEQYDKALEYYEQALGIRRGLDDKSDEGETLKNIGDVYSKLGQSKKSEEFLTQALTAYRAAKDREGEAEVLTALGDAHYKINEYNQAIKFYEPALVIKQTLDDRESEADTLYNLGFSYDMVSRYEEARETFDRALVIYRRLKDRHNEGMTLTALGDAYTELSRYQEALALYKQALVIHREVENDFGEGRTHKGMGDVYDNLGQYDQAADHLNKALLIFRQIPNRGWEGAVLNGLGSVSDSLGKYEQSRDYYEQALLAHREAKNSIGVGNTLNNLAIVYNNLKQYEKAIDSHQQALKIRREIGDRSGESSSLYNLAALYYELDQNDKALDHYEQSLAIRCQIGERNEEAATLRGLMALWWDKGNRRLATFYGKQAVNIYQEIRADIKRLDKESQQSFLKTNENAYRLLAELLLIQDRLSEAHQVLNLFKDQEFFDFAGPDEGSSSPLQTNRVDPTPLEQLEALIYTQAANRVAQAGRQSKDLKDRIERSDTTPAENVRLVELEATAKAEGEQFRSALKQIETDFSKDELASQDRLEKVSDTLELQAALKELNDRTGSRAVALYTLVGGRSYRVLLITPDEIAAKSYTISARDLNRKTLDLLRLLQNSDFDPRPRAKELYEVLIGPVAPELARVGAQTLMWSLDGSLRYLPVSALYDGRQYMVERYRNVVFTRARTERLTAQASGRWTGLGLGVSKPQTVVVGKQRFDFNALPGVPAELRGIFRSGPKAIRGVLDGEVLKDESFTAQAMAVALKRHHPVVHIASHFQFQPGDETSSFLLLGRGGRMTLAEMKVVPNLFNGVELLTLSACNTAAQLPGANGREIDGFAELAQRKGAGAVMATLWPVADQSTPWLMSEFYRARGVVSNATKAEALRRAQLALLSGTARLGPHSAATIRAKIIGAKTTVAGPRFITDPSKPYAHPYYWAPFILIGNWR